MEIEFTYLEITLCLSLVCILGAISGVLDQRSFCNLLQPSLRLIEWKSDSKKSFQNTPNAPNTHKRQTQAKLKVHELRNQKN